MLFFSNVHLLGQFFRGGLIDENLCTIYGCFKGLRKKTTQKK